MEHFIVRKPFGDTFTYQYPSGKTVKNKGIKRWVKSLAIPPAWQEVHIELDRSAKVLAFGRDAQNRKQYIYNPKWAEQASEQKFERILRFAKELSTMRRVTGQHITQRPIDEKTVLACMTRMLDEAFFRPGNHTYTRNNQTFGLTTLRVKHMSIEDGQVQFDYIGKSQQPQHREVDDKYVKKVLIQLEKMTGYELFDITLPDGERKKINAQDLNQYISEVMGEDFSAKDFRTWAGTVLMAVALDELGPATDLKLNKSNVLKAIKKVASELGNTPAVCRSNYIPPNVILHYESGRTLAYFRKQLKRSRAKYFSPDEKATLKLLEYLVSN
ncbi:DNA topoisomerase IB [Aliiglaciecola sp. 3_MG-2023]|uniref:DNA topoisomerase IB n=1 Tax=Aliiglaciecola sp. 3_MG-2023 TaxID=3062644 RepID=UPI0026E45402|nr:DNA topoisomerase IB [Aliiglaciecola sp. 3_MG-2023]MDO6694963.1 DNA topoisomerase IB [Aliiglaciecola sp. 3_MG-2023]